MGPSFLLNQEPTMLLKLISIHLIFTNIEPIARPNIPNQSRMCGDLQIIHPLNLLISITHCILESFPYREVISTFHHLIFIPKLKAVPLLDQKLLSDHRMPHLICVLRNHRPENTLVRHFLTPVLWPKNSAQPLGLLPLTPKVTRTLNSNICIWDIYRSVTDSGDKLNIPVGHCFEKSYDSLTFWFLDLAVDVWVLLGLSPFL